MTWIIVLIPSWRNCKETLNCFQVCYILPVFQRPLQSLASCFQGNQDCSSEMMLTEKWKLSQPLPICFLVYKFMWKNMLGSGWAMAWWQDTASLLFCLLHASLSSVLYSTTPLPPAPAFSSVLASWSSVLLLTLSFTPYHTPHCLLSLGKLLGTVLLSRFHGKPALPFSQTLSWKDKQNYECHAFL